MGTPPQDDPRYLWHAPDGLRARAATGLGCVQAGAEKLGVIEASYASAIIGVVDRPLFREISPFKRHFSRHRRGPHHELSEVYQVSAGCGPGLIGRPERPHALGHVPRISEDHGAPSGPQTTARRS